MSIGFAEKTVDSLQSAIPSDAGEMLLPHAAGGVAALRQLRDGIFLPRQTGANQIEYVNDSGRSKPCRSTTPSNTM